MSGIGEQLIDMDRYYLKTPASEQLEIGRSGYCPDRNTVNGLIIVWSEEDYGKIIGFLENLKSQYPNNEDIITALKLAKAL